MALTVEEIDNAGQKTKKYKLADGGGLCLLVTLPLETKGRKRKSLSVA